MNTNRLYRFAGLSVLACSLACSMSIDVDKYHQASESSSALMDIKFTASHMTSHMHEDFEVRVLDHTNNVLTKAIYHYVSARDFTLYMKGALPRTTPPYRLDFWSDHNHDAQYGGVDGPVSEHDHSWRRELTDPLPADVKLVDGARYEVNFVHDYAFVDINRDPGGAAITSTATLLPCQLNVAGSGAFVGKMMEFRVHEVATGRLVGLYREGVAAREAYQASIPGIIDELTSYRIEAYADADGDNKYSAGDPSWQLDLESNTQGLIADVNVATLAVSVLDLDD
ncbi:hypothetical protein LVJ94_33715 [Pendulispora rubella]|uniref:Uncharacterized protein n=1 Tax=Pendulispora rubella TaxID=2741070 RepID=A0ABZ2KT85_9BACT